MKTLVQNIAKRFQCKALATAFVLVSIGMLSQVHAAHAASFSISPGSGEFKHGCSSTARVIINTGGEASNAADILLTTSNIEILSIRGGNAYTNYAGGGTRFTGFSIGRELNGSATFATLTFRNTGGATSGSIGFVTGGSTSTVIANTSGGNILGGASGANFTFVDGACVDDTQPPVLTNADPAGGAKNVALDSNINFSVTDATGVDKNSIQVIIEGVTYSASSNTANITITGATKNYAVSIDPINDFTAEQEVSVQVIALDTTPRKNKLDTTYSFNRPLPKLPDAPTCEELGCADPDMICEDVMEPPVPTCQPRTGGAMEDVTGVHFSAPEIEIIPEKLESLASTCSQYELTEDTDNDNLSDRIECYIGTNFADRDTDNDTLNDGDEIQIFNTNPLIPDTIAGAPTVHITDPKNNWTVKSLNILGNTDKSSQSVNIILYEANYPYLQNIIDALSFDTNNFDASKSAVESLKNALNQATEFTQTALGDDNQKFKTLAESMLKEVENMERQLNEYEANTAENKPAFALKTNVFENISALKKLQKGAKTIGNISNFQSMDPERLGFIASGINNIPKGTYDIAARSILNNDNAIASLPIRVHIDPEMQTTDPTITSIGGVTITSYDETITISDKRATLQGSSPAGSEVFASWDNGAHVSYTIVDTPEGNFTLSAPDNLKKGNHKVTVHSVQHNDGKTLRSGNIELAFHIATFPYDVMGLILMAIIILIYAIIHRRKKSKK